MIKFFAIGATIFSWALTYRLWDAAVGMGIQTALLCNAIVVSCMAGLMLLGEK